MCRYCSSVGIKEIISTFLCTAFSTLFLVNASLANFMPLQLEVSVNGHKTGLIGSFSMSAAGELMATRHELDELGVSVPGDGKDVLIALKSVPGIRYAYDASSQSVDIQVPVSLLKPQLVRPNKREPAAPGGKQDVGLVTNYVLSFSSSQNWQGLYDFQFGEPSVSVALDTRMYGPHGTLATSALLGSALGSESSAVRLDTAWTINHPENLVSWQFGDLISRGLTWTRPVRLAGVQLRRNFNLRPDLVTSPYFSYDGTAAVPSTVDVFINSAKAASAAVKPGRFVVRDIPTITGPGTATIRIRDATGREVTHKTQFIASPEQLRGGLYDYSVEAGFVRRNYGRFSNDYYDDPVGSATIRYGFSNSITFEAHAEGGSGLINGGVGAVATLFNRCILSWSASMSSYAGQMGGDFTVGLETSIAGARVRISSQRTIGDYQDLASVADRWGYDRTLPFAGYGLPRASDIASVAFPIASLDATASLNFIRRVNYEGQSANIIAAQLSKSVASYASLHLTALHDWSDDASVISLGLSMPLGGSTHALVGYTHDGAGSGVTASYAKVATREPGSFGWRATVTERRVPSRKVNVTYQHDVARAEFGAFQYGSDVALRGSVQGSVVATSRGIFLANTIDDAFAVVDVGEPNVTVLVENQPVARTNANGVALVPQLRSYQRNKVSIDPDTLPAYVEAPEVTRNVTPRDRSGTTVELRAERPKGAAVVIFRDAKHKFIPAGSEGIEHVSGRQFVVGYDGQAYLEGLDGRANVSIVTPSSQCTARFVYAPSGNGRSTIDGVVCQ